MARGRLGEGEPGCSSPYVLVQHQHRTQEGLPPSPQIFASCLKRPFWKLPCWEVWPPGPLSVTPHSGTRAETKTPRGWVIQMLFLLALDPSVLRKPHHGEDLRRVMKRSVAQPPTPSM